VKLFSAKQERVLNSFVRMLEIGGSVAKGVTVKARLNLKIEGDLKEWVMDYAKRCNTDVTKLITEYFIFLRKQEQQQESEYVDQI